MPSPSCPYAAEAISQSSYHMRRRCFDLAYFDASRLCCDNKLALGSIVPVRTSSRHRYDGWGECCWHSHDITIPYYFIQVEPPLKGLMSSRFGSARRVSHSRLAAPRKPYLSILASCAPLREEALTRRHWYSIQNTALWHALDDSHGGDEYSPAALQDSRQPIFHIRQRR